MSDVFVSYKREDETRVAPLVQALEAAGLDVWWDRGLPGGESWRANIEAALNGAKCVVVVWSTLSVGAAGHFVRDEAAHAMARGQLVPVLIDPIAPPLGFRELQAVDLTHWNGRVGDPFFQDLVAAIKAKLEGKPAPRAAGPVHRLRRRLTIGSLATLMLAIGSSFALNAFGSASYVCTAAGMQPLLSDGCGAVGIGGRPTFRERTAWEHRRPGSCEDLRNYGRDFPDSIYAAQAANLVTLRKPGQREVLEHMPQTLPLTVSRNNTPASTIDAAHAATLLRSRSQAEDTCRGYTQTGLFRYKATVVQPEEWSCDPFDGGFVCGLNGHVTCDLDKIGHVETETCGAVTARP